MNASTITILITAFTLLLGIIGFLLVRNINHQDKINDEQKETNRKMYGTFDRLNATISDLNTTLKVFQSHNADFEASCKVRHEILDKQLDKITT